MDCRYIVAFDFGKEDVWKEFYGDFQKICDKYQHPYDCMDMPQAVKDYLKERK